MKKFVWPLVGLMLVAYVVWLSAYFQVVETVLIFLVPLFLCALLGTVVYLFIRLFGGRPAYAKALTVSALVSLVVQGGALGRFLSKATSDSFHKEVVVRDIDALIKTMEEVHPDLYNRIPRERYYRQVDSLKATLPEQVSREHTAKALCQMTAWIEDGHTGQVGWMNSLPIFFRKMAPYKFRIIEDRLYVADTYGWFGRIPPGSEVVEINGLPAATCLAQVSGLFSWETLAFRNMTLEENPLIWGLWNDFRSFVIRYRTPDGKLKKVRSSGGIIAKLLRFANQSEVPAPQGEGEKYSYKTLSPGVGYLEFYEPFDHIGFSAFLDTTFRQVQRENITHLIVDIRKNRGGNSALCDDLMQYISKTPFRLSESVVRKMSAQAREKFPWIDSANYKIGEFYTQSAGLRQLAENPLRFGGKVYMLMGGVTFSSGTMLAAGFQCYGVGTTIGSETGGATASFGDLYFYILPETGYKLVISTTDFVLACGKHDRRGVIPDHVVIPTIEDELAGRDPVLDFTLNLIRRDE